MTSTVSDALCKIRAADVDRIRQQSQLWHVEDYDEYNDEGVPLSDSRVSE